MRIVRIYAKASGESAIDTRGADERGAAGKGHITRSLRDTRGFVHVAMPDDFDLSSWPLVRSGA